MRRDTRRNSKRLINAVGELAKEDPEALTMVAVAARADVALATAYRHFASLEQLLEAFRVKVVSQLADFTDASPATGEALYTAVLERWYELLLEHGPALVLTRSPKGYLARLREQGEYAQVSRRAWERPIRELLAAHDVELETDIALFLHNILNDPREVLDLAAHHEAVPVEQLMQATLGAMRGWAAGR